MIVRQILKSKGSTVTSVPASESIANVATLLMEARIGAVLVRGSNGDPVGILSERDIVEGLAAQGANVLAADAASLMTGDLVTCSPDDQVDALMRVVTNQRVRHLPVMEHGQLAGIVSIGDLVKARIGELETEGEELAQQLAVQVCRANSLWRSGGGDAVPLFHADLGDALWLSVLRTHSADRYLHRAAIVGASGRYIFFREGRAGQATAIDQVAATAMVIAVPVR